jgi:diacylglycerol O-acyltransferase / wax synthase
MPNTRNGKRRLSFLDASFLYGESTVSPTHVGSIFALDGEVTFEQVIAHTRQRLHISPRFRQRLVFAPFNLAHPTLEEDPDFRLENHIRRQQLPPGISESDAIQEIVRQHFGRVMDRSRPLWDVTLFEGPSGRSLLVWAMHHAVVDGVSWFETLNGLMDFTPNPRAEPVPDTTAAGALPSAAESFVSAVHDLAVEQLDTLLGTTREFVRNPMITAETLTTANRLMSELAQPAIATPWNSGMAVGERHLSFVKKPFADYRRIRTTFGGTINDVVLTILGEAAARYLRHHGWPTSGMLRFSCPVNVRRPGEQVTLENRISVMMPSTPAAPMDVVERLKLITQQTTRIKQSGAPYLMERLTSMTASIPPAVLGAASAIGALNAELMAALIRSSNWRPIRGGFGMPNPTVNFVATNVPGPQTPWFFAGHKVTDMFGLLPLGGNLGYGVGITSYDQHITFSMMSDQRMMPDPELMQALVDEAFEELRARVPGEAANRDVVRPAHAEAA